MLCHGFVSFSKNTLNNARMRDVSKSSSNINNFAFNWLNMLEKFTGNF